MHLEHALTFVAPATVKRHISPHAVTLGCFDGRTQSLAVVDTVGKVFLYNIETVGSTASGDDQSVGVPGFRLNPSASTVLNINKQVKVLTSGRLSKEDARDVIVIGTASHLLVYDVENNSDVFYNRVTDGLESIIVGQFGNSEEKLIVCGGCCSLQGFDWQGAERFWSVTGGSVRAMCFCDFDSDGIAELVVGSDDSDIRVFKWDEICAEVTETEAVTELHSLGENRFAYGLSNGTLGVYAGRSRLWRIKSKSNPTCMCLYDIDGDGELELVTGWSSGKVDFRKIKNGSLVGKDHIGSSAVGMVLLKMASSERVHLICCSASGEVRGYSATKGRGCVVNENTLQEAISDLSIEKQNLLLELENYRVKEETERPMGPLYDQTDMRIPTDTQVSGEIGIVVPKDADPYLSLTLRTNNDSVIRGAVVFAEGIFNGESHAAMAPKNQCKSSIEVQIRPNKDVSTDLHIKVLLGNRKSTLFYVFELTKTMPKFSMYAPSTDNAPSPKCGVHFRIKVHCDQFIRWIEDNFLLCRNVQFHQGRLQQRLVSLRNGQLVFIVCQSDGNAQIRCDDIEICGSMLQTLSAYIDADFKVSAYFPNLAGQYTVLDEKVREISSVRDRISADIAEQVSLAKMVLLRAEDSRALNDFAGMKNHYKQLANLNDALISLHNVRKANSAELADSLRKINKIIQCASNLRVGQHRSAFIRACRSAISTGNLQQMQKLLPAEGQPLDQVE
uniref:Bardet-Biedl syndrome 2 protein homolog n=1 Tax=Trichuris muris TaxID=70415 RepID=A0A5S6QVD6_TRIMR